MCKTYVLYHHWVNFPTHWTFESFFFFLCTYTDIWMNIFKGFLHFELFISLEVKYWRKEFDDFNTEKI